MQDQGRKQLVKSCSDSGAEPPLDAVSEIRVQEPQERKEYYLPTDTLERNVTTSAYGYTTCCTNVSNTLLFFSHFTLLGGLQKLRLPDKYE